VRLESAGGVFGVKMVFLGTWVGIKGSVLVGFGQFLLVFGWFFRVFCDSFARRKNEGHEERRRNLTTDFVDDSDLI